MRRDSKAFRERFQRWKAGEAVYDNGRPIEHYADGEENILPELTVTGYRPIKLRTYYPLGKEYPYTGHSKLEIPLTDRIANEYGFISDEAQKNRFYGEIVVDKSGRSKDYNLISNNCADATLGFLNDMFETDERPMFFTTPGDVRDFAIKKLGGVAVKERGVDTVLIPRNKANADFLSQQAVWHLLENRGNGGIRLMSDRTVERGPYAHYADGREPEEPDALRTNIPTINRYRQQVADINAAVRAMRQQNTTQVSTDTRSTAERQRVNKQATTDRQRIREEQQKQKNEEAFWNLVSLTSPSTYIGQAVGQPIEGAAALAIDALAFGGAGALKNGVKAAAKTYATRGFNKLNTPRGLLSDEPLIARGNLEITAENAASITPEQWTAAQDAAIARGDMAEAQRLRDLHFKVSAPTPYITEGVYLPSGIKPTLSQADYYNGNNDLVTLYHSSVDADNLIKEGFDGIEHGLGRTKGEPKGTIFASANQDYAADYSNLYVQEGFSTPDKVGLIELKVPRGSGVYEGNEVRLRPEHIKEITKSAYEKTPWLRWLKTRKADNNLFNIKSADVVTYDNNGVRIPLGERDNFEINNINYGISADSSPYSIPSGTTSMFEKYLYDQIIQRSVKELIEGGDRFFLWKAGQAVDMATPDELKQIYYNSVLPRMQFMRGTGWRGGLLRPTVKSNVDAALERGYTVYNKNIWDKSSASIYDGFNNFDTGHIAIKQGSEDFALGHEYRHRLDRLLPKNSVESGILEDAYGADFLKLSEYYPELKDVRMAYEAVTTNFDARLQAIGKYHALDTNWKLQNRQTF